MAKVARGVTEAATEVIMPYAVYHAAPREHVARMRQPFGQRRPAFGLILWILQRKTRGQMREGRKPAWLGHSAGFVKIASFQNIDDLRLGDRPHRVAAWNGDRGRGRIHN